MFSTTLTGASSSTPVRTSSACARARDIELHTTLPRCHRHCDSLHIVVSVLVRSACASAHCHGAYHHHTSRSPLCTDTLRRHPRGDLPGNPPTASHNVQALVHDQRDETPTKDLSSHPAPPLLIPISDEAYLVPASSAPALAPILPRREESPTQSASPAGLSQPLGYVGCELRFRGVACGPQCSRSAWNLEVALAPPQSNWPHLSYPGRRRGRFQMRVWQRLAL